ncbi:hypothetical protein, partial [Faecalispora jeddahensis]|uniref:hypothetical protein n=1 Tax=Faecalispora jeddahensis TaxID=1414721 RepID=UPI00164E0B30
SPRKRKSRAGHSLKITLPYQDKNKRLALALGAKLAQAEPPRGEHSLKTFSFIPKMKKEKFHPGIRVIPVPAEFPYEATHTKRKEEAFAMRQRFFFSLSSAPGVLHSHQDYL